MTMMIKLGSALGQVTLDEFLSWNQNKQRNNLLPNRNIPTKEHLARAIAARKGKPAWNRGICHLSDEAKKRISEARKKTKGLYKNTYQSKPVMTYYGPYPSKTAVARAAGVDPGTVSNWIKKYPEHYYYITKDTK